MRLLLTVLLFTCISFLSGCAYSPFKNVERVNRDITPGNALAYINQPDKKTDVIWAGIIIASSKQGNETQIEVLSYPVDETDRPDITQKSNGRFFIVTQQSLTEKKLETGNQLSVSGVIEATTNVTQNTISNTYPVIRSKQLYIWTSDTETQVYFGFGISIHN